MSGPVAFCGLEEEAMGAVCLSWPVSLWGGWAVLLGLVSGSSGSVFGGLGVEGTLSLPRSLAGGP